MPRYIGLDENRLYRTVVTKVIAANRFGPEQVYTFSEGPYTTAGQAHSRLTYHERRAARSQSSTHNRFTVAGWVEAADVVWEPLA